MKRIKLSDDIKEIIKIMKDSGFECYVVGGFIRDSLFKKPSKDIDFATDAEPEDICGIFNKTILTGMKHGTVTICYKEKYYEMTTYRTDENDSKSSIETDLNHRDFTINAIAYDGKHYKFPTKMKKQCLADIKSKTLRTVGSAKDRFNEDPLRLLRAIRFSAKYNLSFDSEVHKCLMDKEFVERLKEISKERIRDELVKIVEYYYIRRRIDLLGRFYHVYKTAVYNYPKTKMLAYNFVTDNAQHFYYAYPDKHYIFIMIMTYLFKTSNSSIRFSQFKMFLKELKFSNEFIKIAEFVYTHSGKAYISEIDMNHLWKEAYDFGIKDINETIELISAINEQFGLYQSVLSNYFERHRNKFAISVADLDVNGDDLKLLFIEGKDIGRCLELALNAVISGYCVNKKSKLLKYIKNFICSECNEQ